MAADAGTNNLKNDDFRKFLSTPSAHSLTSSSTKSTVRQHGASFFSHKQTAIAAANSATKNKQKRPFRPPPKEKDEKDTIFDESQAKLNEVLLKYRDRASERRKGMVPEDEDLRNRLAAAYKTVPNVFATNAPSTDRRKLEIQESKYLGGDIEHTYLVKGLDYSLLNKVRSEIENVEKDKELDEALEQERQSQELPVKQANTKLAKNMCQILFDTKIPLRNENFARGRMAYLVELEDDIESDVPSTLLRSVHDCPVDRSSENINADNVLINKLTQILAYLRADTKKRKRGTERDRILESTKIYDEAGDHVPSTSKRDTTDRGRRDEDRSRHNKGERSADRPKSYFDSRHNDGNDRDTRDREKDYRSSRGDDRDDRRRADEERLKQERDEEDRNEELEKIKKRRLEQEEAYSEFYPMGVGMFDAGGDSDDEADYTKMDMGNRKGPVKRWDFDNEEDFERYQGQREALPRAAYQFGVKMNAGRKTRKGTTAQNEKKLDRELAKINRIIESRGSGAGGGSSK